MIGPDLAGAVAGKRDVRVPARVNEIAKIAEGPLEEGTLLDLSHESLIRQWRSLAGWVTDEAKSAEMYRRLRDWALRWEQGKAELWRGQSTLGIIAVRCARRNTYRPWCYGLVQSGGLGVR